MKLIGDRRTWNKIEHASPELIRELSKPEVKDEVKVINSLEVNLDIDLDKYICIPGTDLVISEEELYKGKNWEESHFELQKNGLIMPRPDQFMKFYLSVRDAFNGNVELEYASGNNVPIEKAEDLWKYLSSEHKGGCWAHLDSKFEESSSGLYLLTDHRVVNGKLEAKTRKDLECPINENCYVDLEFNIDGFPIKKSPKKEFDAQSNIYFYKPVKDSVARFGANSDRSYFICYGYPQDSDSGLGVFACAEGVRPTNFLRGSK